MTTRFQLFPRATLDRDVQGAQCRAGHGWPAAASPAIRRPRAGTTARRPATSCRTRPQHVVVQKRPVQMRQHRIVEARQVLTLEIGIEVPQPSTSCTTTPVLSPGLFRIISRASSFTNTGGLPKYSGRSTIVIRLPRTLATPLSHDLVFGPMSWAGTAILRAPDRAAPPVASRPNGTRPRTRACASRSPAGSPGALLMLSCAIRRSRGERIL